MSSSINNSALDQIYIASHYTANTHTYTRTRYCTRRNYLTFILHCTIRHTDRHYTIKLSTTTPQHNIATTEHCTKQQMTHYILMQCTETQYSTLSYYTLHYSSEKYTTIY